MDLVFIGLTWFFGTLLGLINTTLGWAWERLRGR